MTTDDKWTEPLDNVTKLVTKAKSKRGAGGKFGVGSGMPATGAGYGGPAKGASSTVGEVADYHSSKPEIMARRPEREDRARVFNDTLYDIATDTDQPGNTRVQAAVAGLNRLEGMPVQRNVNLDADDLARLTDDELRAELARFSGTAP